MNKPRYFTLEELIRSDTAVSKKIPNLPTWDIIDNLNRLALFLDEMRDAWGSGIIVSSGYRCARLNKAVGGVENSTHQRGNAVDIVPANGRMKEFEDFLRDWLKDKMFDECLWESKKTGAKWVHFGLVSNKGLQRRKMFGITAK